MVSTDAPPPSSVSVDPTSSPRISFSADFVDDPDLMKNKGSDGSNGGGFERDQIAKAADFEFLSTQILRSQSAMSTADELFSEGKLLPFCQMQKSAEKLEKISLKAPADDGADGERAKEDQPAAAAATTSRSGKTEPRIWLMDDDTSPRPPNCTVLWKELLRLKKQRAASSLSHSSSSSSSSSSGSMDEGKEGKEGQGMSTREKHLRRIKKGLERTRSASIRIRPMVNVPICTQGKSSGLPPLFPLKKGRVVER